MLFFTCKHYLNFLYNFLRNCSLKHLLKLLNGYYFQSEGNNLRERERKGWSKGDKEEALVQLEIFNVLYTTAFN